MALRLSGTRRGGVRVSESFKLGPFRLWISKPLGKGRNGRRRTWAGWSIKL